MKFFSRLRRLANWIDQGIDLSSDPYHHLPRPVVTSEPDDYPSKGWEKSVDLDLTSGVDYIPDPKMFYSHELLKHFERRGNSQGESTIHSRHGPGSEILLQISKPLEEPNEPSKSGS